MKTTKAPGAFTRKQIEKRKKLSTRRLIKLIEALAEVIPIGSSIVDLGAGNGRIAQALIERGYNVDAFDGAEDIEKATDGFVKYADLTKDNGNLNGAYDWALFLEVGEHVPVEYEQGLFDEVSQMSIQGLIVSWATPNLVWPGHVNNRLLVYVAGEFARRGWLVDEPATRIVGEKANRFIRRRLIVFRKWVKAT